MKRMKCTLDVKRRTIHYFRKYILHNKKLSKKSCNNVKNLIDHEEFDLLQIVIKKSSKHNSRVSLLVLNYCIDTQSYIALENILSRDMIDINCSLDQYGWTIFHRAAYTKEYELMRHIVCYGAKIDIIDNNGNTPFHILIQSLKHTQANSLNMSKDNEIGSKLLLNLVELMINYCEAQNKNILNYKNYFGKTVLHYAVVNTNVINKSYLYEFISLLIQSGADPDAKDGRFRTPIYCAIDEQCYSSKQAIVIKALVDAKCDTLNLYQFENLGFEQNFTLKQICRTFLVNNYPNLLFSDSRHLLPRELISYLKTKLVIKSV